MRSRKYHVHGYSASGRRLAVHMYRTLAEALRSAKNMVRKGGREATVYIREADGRSYEPYRRVVAFVDPRNFKVSRILVYALPENEQLLGRNR